MERSVIIYSRAQERFRGREEELASLCPPPPAGFNLIHLAVSPARLLAQDGYSGSVRRALRAFHLRGMEVFALFLNDASAIVSPEKAGDAAKAVIAFNAATGQGEGFDGLSADLEPNMLKADSPERPKDFPLAWDSKEGWGPDGANLKLLERTLQALKFAKAAAPKLKLHAFYSPSWMKQIPPDGERAGSPSAFLSVCDRIVLMAYASSPEETAAIAKKAFKLAGKDFSVALCVKARKGSSDSLGSAGLDAFSQNMRALSGRVSEMRQLAGVSIYEFEGLLEMLDETEK